MTEVIEEQLIADAQANPEAFGVLFEEHYSKILGYTVRRVGNVAIGQDITSEVFFKALKNIKRFEYRGVPFCAWLYKIATNEINHYFRTKKVRLVSLDSLSDNYGVEFAGETDVAEELMEAQDIVERHASFGRIQQHITKLPLKYQEVLALRYFEEKKVREIAEILEKKEGTVKSLLSRGVGRLQVIMDAETQKKFDHTKMKAQPIPAMRVTKSD